MESLDRKKRGIFLKDFLLRKGFEEIQADYLVQLKEDYPDSDFKEVVRSLSKTETNKFITILDHLKIGD